MVTVEQIAQIRHAYYNERRSIRWIAREYHHSRAAVRRALGTPEPRRYTRTKAKPAPVMDAWKGRIDALLAESETLPRKQRNTAQRIYDLLRGEGYAGCIGGVRRYVAKKRGRARPAVQVYVPLVFDPGQDAQADWGEAAVELNGEVITAQVFGLRLCYSRTTFLCAYPTQRQECLFDGHVRAFEFFGGVPQRISYDNLTTAVQAVLAGRKRREQEAFTQFRSAYLFESHFCTPGEGHEKGQIEHALGYGRRNFLTPLLKATSWAELNAQLLRACQNDLTRTVDGQASPIFDLLLHERPRLRPLPAQPFACCVTTQATLTPYSQVIFETNRYSVPAEAAATLPRRHCCGAH
jgi:transposase